MQRNFLRGLLVCLIPCLVAALFAVRPEKYRLGIDLAGGTILVYEVNLERTKLREEMKKSPQEREKEKEEGKEKEKDTRAAGLTGEQINQLASQIKKRIDPTDIKNVTVRPSGDRRIEIILPTGGATGGRAALSQEDVEEAKRLISQMGVLEFRILANGPDDEKGIVAARQAIAAAAAKQDQAWVDPRKQLADPTKATPEPASELQVLAARGLPPNPPEGEFAVDINDTKAMVRYAWVELGPEERETLGLSNADEGKSTLWMTLHAKRNDAVPISPAQRSYIESDPVNCKMLIYSRDCVNAEQLAKEKVAYEKLKAEQAKSGLTDEQIKAQVNDKKVEYFLLTRVSDSDTLRITDNITITANSSTDKSFNLAVEFHFNGAGAQQFGKITRRNKPTGNHQRQLAIVLDERIVSAPALHGEITSTGQITGGEKGFDRKSVDRLVQILRSGALSAELREKPVSENMIGATLGEDTIKRGVRAVGMAFIAVLIFMVIYYRFAGLVACIALFANLLLTIGFMVAVNAAFTLPGLAGLVLTLGMAVDANVLIYERLREERNKGANIATAIRNGYDRAFLTIIDTHLTSIFTAIVLYTLGNDNLKGFAISLTVGLVISLFTSLYMTRLMFDFWLHKRWLTELKMMRLFEKPNFNPMKFRWFFFPFTAVLTIAGLALFVHRVYDEDVLNVDFRGGTVFAGKLKDGEERGLTKIGDQLGYRELLSQERQDKLLAVKKDAQGKPMVSWDNKPANPDTPLSTWIYTITYQDGGTQTVTLTERPVGNNADEMAVDVAQRASRLPDTSVEQTYTLDEDRSSGKSKRFTVRTTEKQRALVQAGLDRLMREDGKLLLDGATMTIGPVTGTTVELTFDKPTSLAFTTELFAREFKKQSMEGPGMFALSGVGEPVDGRFQKMKLDVAGNNAFEKLRDPKDKDYAAQLQSLKTVVDGTKQAFDSTPEPERLEVFDSQLAKETREKAMLAVFVSWIAIILYLWFRFGNWTFGLAAVICLVHDLCFTLGAIAICHYLHLIPGFSYLGIEDFKIDLVAVAALLTLVGYSVNEIIVNFARVREVRGKNPKLTPEMINDSVNQTLSRTILTAMTVFLVSIVLYVFGGEGVHLFAFVMVIGVMVATYSSIFVACPLLLFLGEGHDTAGTMDEPSAAEKEETTEEEVVEG